MAQNRKMIADQLTDILKETRAGYASCKERDRMEQARNGAQSIQTRGFAFGEIEQEACDMVRKAGARALAIIDKELKAAGGALVEAPTTEAANYVATLTARDNLTADEAAAALSRYTDHASQKAIKTAAARSGLHQYAGMTDAETYMADLRDLRADVSKLYAPATFGDVSDGMSAIHAAGYKNFAQNPGGGVGDLFACLSAGE